jgi:hypothetical protein
VKAFRKEPDSGHPRSSSRLAPRTRISRQGACACGGGCPRCEPAPLMPKLAVSSPGDPYELEADRVTDTVMRTPAPEAVGLEASTALQRCGSTPADLCPCHDAPPVVGEVLRSAGRPLDAATRAFVEPRFGRDFGDVRVHTDERAAESASAVDALAYTVGSNVVFGAGQYAPGTSGGQRLLAHELAHVVQQERGGHSIGSSMMAVSQAAQPTVQRTLGDGHDLTSLRFSHLLDLEAAFDGEAAVRHGDSGAGVSAIQQALRDLGYPLPLFGADGHYGVETEAAVKSFQRDNHLAPDGIVGRKTMATLDAISPAPLSPGPVTPATPAASAPAVPAAPSTPPTWILCIHSNVSSDEGAHITDGHSWLTLHDGAGAYTSYGLWPDEHPDIGAAGLSNGEGSDVRVNFANDRRVGKFVYCLELTPEQRREFERVASENWTWRYTNTCASFAGEAFESATGVDVDADDVLGFETPRELGESIAELNGGVAQGPLPGGTRGMPMAPVGGTSSNTSAR